MELFDKIYDIDIGALNAIIEGNAIHEYKMNKLTLFDLMKHLGIDHKSHKNEEMENR